MRHSRYVYVHSLNEISDGSLTSFSPHDYTCSVDRLNAIDYLNNNAGKVALVEGFSGRKAIANDDVILHEDWFTYIDEKTYGEEGLSWYIFLNEIRSIGLFTDFLDARVGQPRNLRGIFLMEDAGNAYKEPIALVSVDKFELLKPIDDAEKMGELSLAVARMNMRTEKRVPAYEVEYRPYKISDSNLIGSLVLVEKRGFRGGPKLATMEEFKELDLSKYNIMFTRGYAQRVAKKLWGKEVYPFRV